MGKQLLQGGRVLVVSQDEKRRTKLVEIIQGAGFETREADVLDASEELFHLFRPEAVVFYVEDLVDFRFGSVRAGASGTLHPLPAFLLVYVSESGQEKERAIGEGVDEFLLWPVVPAELVHRIRSAVRRYRAEFEYETNLTELNSALETIRGYNNDLSIEFTEARECQVSMLPARRMAMNGFVINTSIKVGKKLNGDFVDLIRMDPFRIVIVLVDVSGHGAAAALVTGMAHAWLHSNVHDRVSLAALTKGLNSYLLTFIPEPMYATGFFGILDTMTGDLEYVLAGHLEPLLWQNGACVYGPEAETPPLGLYDEFRALISRLHIAPSDALMVFSDGLQDAFLDMDYAQQRLCDLFHQHNLSFCLRNRSCSMIADILKEGRVPQDDMSMICIKRLPEPFCIGSLKVSIPETGRYEFSLLSTEYSIMDLTRFMVDHLREEVGEERFWDMLQVAMELLNNAMEWGNDFDPTKNVLCTVDIFRSGREIVLTVEDQGKGFDTASVVEYSRNIDPDEMPVDETRPGGLGISLALGLSDRLSFNKKGNRVTAHFIRSQQ